MANVGSKTRGCRKTGSVSMRQVAERAGVSVATVSNLLSGRSGAIRVSAETRARVLGVCKDVGYEPNVHTQRMLAKKSFMLGMIFPDLRGFLQGRHTADVNLGGVLQGATVGATRHGYQVVLNPATQEFVEDKKYLQLYRSKAVDAFLIWGVTVDAPFVDELYDEGVPFVLLQSRSRSADERGYAFIGSKDFDVTVKCVDHLVSLGHRDIAYIQGRQTSSVGIDRWQGFRSGMQNHGLFNEELVEPGDYGHECGRVGAEKLLKKNPNLTAIVCAGEASAIGAMEYLAEQGKRVPKDISIIGGDGIQRLVGMRMTTFLTRTYDIGERAAELAIQQLDKGKAFGDGIRELLEPDLYFGDTTAPAASGV